MTRLSPLWCVFIARPVHVTFLTLPPVFFVAHLKTGVTTGTTETRSILCTVKAETIFSAVLERRNVIRVFLFRRQHL